MNIVTAQNERPESRLALDWILANGPQLAGDPTELTVHVVLAAGTDSPASPNYSSFGLGRSIADELEEHNITHTVYPAGSDAAVQILDTAHTVSADLVVIGMRRRSATMKLLLGSQVQRVMLDAPCPVVTVKTSPD
ncbi:universal stress protein [Rhodococcoides kyotonense]|uniref:Universal stress protein family protein n=1 Tax=Rhodococcoides kyotonense TaxID=398843 RepID=A0A239MX23_9NOCA|nr:universal stress protein [Rhodococcus kyotonensis]SNT47337.1 Universal stress protein family protein [Rhodococcus kyotonensis]